MAEEHPDDYIHKITIEALTAAFSVMFINNKTNMKRYDFREVLPTYNYVKKQITEVVDEYNHYAMERHHSQSND